MYESIIAVLSLLAGGLSVWLVGFKSLKNRHKNEIGLLKEEYDRQRQNINELNTQKATLVERVRGLEQKSARFEQLTEEYADSKSKIAQLETMLEKERQMSAEKLSTLEENKEHMKLEFKELADKILASNSEKFSTQNKDALTKMITPIKEQFDAFKKQIDDVYIKEAKDRSMLQSEIKAIKEINHQMSTDAKNLTRALKGESKKQGIWGEMILERVLESSGLREGHEYERETSLHHEGDGSRFRPDVIVHLPDTREIIIDAKTSLRAYEQYINENDENDKNRFALLHVASMKKHVDELSAKDYTKLKGVETLDFIFMFVPIESALLMAMESDPTLFDYAFKKRVVLVGPTTLMVSLRAVENTWKYEHQQRNAQEIAKRAGLLFDKFVGFVESVEKLGKQIQTVQKTYEETYNKLHLGAGSITTQFQKLEKLGAAASKSIPEHIARQIEE
ncbi:DNA recombination protein RmuC [Sulfurimonas sp. HSL-1716]|uniref:DNA recombination protein RmuC n=1 Tax=Hydrocurvibacter sulfurireducens TaxID=3131937 RepID=UPI0031F7B260